MAIEHGSTQEAPAPPAARVDRSAAPIFVGGTGRSGTTIVGRMLGRDADYEVIPTEVKFHCHQDGLPGLLAGAVSAAEVAERVRAEWFGDETRGLAVIVERDALEESLDRFVGVAGGDPEGACRELMDGLLGGYARSRGKSGWVEMTPLNAMWAPHLARIYPELRMVHTVRDGRDVAASLVGLGWVADVPQALEWWEERLLWADRMCGRVGGDGALVVGFERLVVEDRECAFAELATFVDCPDSAAVRRYFDRRVTPELAHIGRWRTSLDAADRAFLEQAYPQTLARLREAGVACV
jgi:hypothetical protein